MNRKRVQIQKFSRQCSMAAHYPNEYHPYEVVYERAEARTAVREYKGLGRFEMYTDRYVELESNSLIILSVEDTKEEAFIAAIVNLFPFGTNFDELELVIKDIDKNTEEIVCLGGKKDG